MSSRRGGPRSNERRSHGTSRGRYSRGYEDHSHNSHSYSNNRTPIILAKPERNENNRSNNDESRPSSTHSESKSVLTRSNKKESSGDHSSSQRNTDSPKPAPSPASHESFDSNDVSNFIPTRNVKLVDDQIFCEPLADCMSDNQDFMVVGVIGTQGVGKSFILNSVIKLSNHQTLNPEDSSNYNADGTSKPQPERTFRVQTFEKQMLSEHCTNGINCWVGKDRIIYLDTQPLFSNSFLDRAVQLEKKFSFEYFGAENTMEVHSLQMIGYLMSICHVVLIVQEGSLCDVDFLEKIRMADLLKPSNPACASFEDPVTTVEYVPEIIFVHNKLELSEMGPQNYEELRKVYTEAFDDEGLHFRYKTNLSGDNDDGGVNLILIPDVESEENLKFSDENLTLEESLLKLRRSFSKLQMRPFTTNVKQTEKSWFQHTQKSWENIKTSNFYMEYSRLLRNH